MYLHNFPLDSQKCPLLIGSFAYQAKDVIYIWRKGINHSVTSNPDLELSQYVLRSIAMGFANQTREAKEGTTSKEFLKSLLLYDLNEKYNISFNALYEL